MGTGNNVFLFVVMVLVLSISCLEPSGIDADKNAPFESIPDLYKLKPGHLNEVSGMADSRINAGYIWTEQDSGAPPELALIDKKANFVKKISIKNADNRDWEDMAIGPGPEKDIPYVYIADIGDNGSRHTQSFFYRFPEPGISTDTVINWEKISYVYADGPRDAEAFLVDNNLDIYIITKENKSRIYKIPYPQSIEQTNTASFVGELPFKGVVSAAISDDGTEIILKTYKKLFYWKKPKEENIGTALSRPFINLGYKREKQGEAICFAKDGSCFFTLSEKPMFTSAVYLQCYKRK
jgi:hypothetical protein